MATLDKLNYDITADSTDFRRELKRVSEQFERFQRRQRRSFRGLKSAGAGAATGVAALGAAAAATTVALGAKSVQAAAKFEGAIADAGAKAQATVEQMRAMEEAAFEASSTSAFSANDAATAMGNLAQAGLSVKDQIAALPGTLTLASAGNVDLGEASEIAVKGLKAFRLEADQMSRVGDVLAKAATSSNTSVSQLGESLANAGGIAGETGQTFEGTISVLSAMQDVGVKAASAGTAVRSALAKLSAEGGKAERAINRLGVNVRTADGELRQLSEILADMADAGADAGDFVDAFGEKVGPQLVGATSKGSAGLRSFTAALHDAGGTAQEVADRQLDNAQGQLKILSGSVETLGIVIGKTMTPALKDAATKANAFVNELRSSDEMIEQLRGGLGDMIAALGGSVELLGHVGESTINILGTLSFQFDDAYEAGDRFREMTDRAAGAMGDAAAQTKAFGIEHTEFRKKLAEVATELYAVEKALDSGNVPMLERIRLQRRSIDLEKQRQQLIREAEIDELTAKAGQFEALDKQLGDVYDRLLKVQAVRDQIRARAEAEGINLQALSSLGGQIQGADPQQQRQLELLRTAWLQVNGQVNKLEQQRDRLQTWVGEAIAAQNELVNMGVGADKAVGDAAEKADKIAKTLLDTGAAADEAGRKAAEGFGQGFIGEFATEQEQALRDVARGLGDQMGASVVDSINGQMERIAIADKMRAEAMEAGAAMAQGVIGSMDRIKDETDQRVSQMAQAWESRWASMGQSIGGAFSSALEDTLFNAFMGNMEDMEQTLKRFAAQLIRVAAQAAILSAVQGAGGGVPMGFASGGYVSGPGTSTSDSIPAYLSDGEYVIPAASVQHYGVGFMEAVRSLSFPSAPQGFAQGGLAKSGGGGVDLTILNPPNQEAMEQLLASRRGQSLIINALGNNPDMVRRIAGVR